MPGIFSNGSALERPMSTRLSTAPHAQQPADQYFGQQFHTNDADLASLQREQKQIYLLERGRELAGFIQRDRRAEGRGFEWQRTRGAQWPAEMPPEAAAAVEQAIRADQAARAAFDSAVMQFNLWAQSRTSASEALVKLKYEELTIDHVAPAQRAGEQLDRVLVQAAVLVDQIGTWRQIEQAAPGRQAAAERQYQAALDKIETDLMLARQAVQRAGVKV